MFQDLFRNKKVLVTGHTGFKGSWLTYWLLQLGANVCGYALAPNTTPSLFDHLSLQECIDHHIADINEVDQLFSVANAFQPEMVFHLAAQPLVRQGYQYPTLTFNTNAMGTLNVLELIRTLPSIQTAVMITSDKCYENHNGQHAFRESDRLGGSDPYSASKACAEFICHAYYAAYFRPTEKRIAMARSGNVVGGGDWSVDRLIPDAIRAWTDKTPLIVRHPEYVRPWLHVLESLSGYLWLAACLLDDPSISGEAFNFGPKNRRSITTEEVVTQLHTYWPEGHIKIANKTKDSKSEASYLQLNSQRARECLGWESVLTFEETIEMTAACYKAYFDNSKKISVLMNEQITYYCQRAQQSHLSWSKKRVKPYEHSTIAD